MMELVCPAGRYCPNASVAFECPPGFTCPEGSLQPMRCFVLAVCPTGSSSEVFSARAPAALLLALGLVMVYSHASRSRPRVTRGGLSVSGGGGPRVWRCLRGLPIFWRAKASDGVGGAGVCDGLELSGAPVSATRTARSAMQYAAFDEEAEAEGSQGGEMTTAMADAGETAKVGEATDGSQGEMGVEVYFEGLNVQLKSSGRTVVEAACGRLRRGEMTAVMGPSGSGKTTLLSALAGRVAFVGDVRVDGVAARGGVGRHLGSSFAFVPQEDVMYRQLTVEENVWLSASFRLVGNRIGRRERICHAVARVMEQMRLAGVSRSTVGDEVVRGVSGGERKRVNIALELVAKPRCMFVDEPTTGLDATAAKEVIGCLRGIVRAEGITIVCVVHQPRHEVFSSFDSLLLLARGGRIVYEGAPASACGVYESAGLVLPPMCSLSDFLLDIVSDKAHLEPISALWRARVESFAASAAGGVQASGASPGPLARVGEAATRIGGIGIGRQLMLCLVLHLKLRYRRVGTPLLEILLIGVYALCVGIIFYRTDFEGPLTKAEQAQCPSMLATLCTLPIKDMVDKRTAVAQLGTAIITSLTSISLFARDAAVTRRYCSWGVLMPNYVIAGMTVHALELAVQPLIFCTIADQLWGSQGAFINSYIVLLAVVWAASGIGYLTVFIIASGEKAQFAGVALIIILTIFSGAAAPLPQLRASEIFGRIFFLSELSFIRFGLEASYVQEIEQYKDTFDITGALAMHDYELERYWHALLMVCLHGAAFRLAAVVCSVWIKPST
jgi:ABC-type multidrug transport system ATPase subunit